MRTARRVCSSVHFFQVRFLSDFVKTSKLLAIVIPAKAGIQ